MVYIVEYMCDDANVCGVVYLASNLELARQWIRTYGEEWAGGDEGSSYIITGQEVDGDHEEFECFGGYDLKGNSTSA